MMKSGGLEVFLYFWEVRFSVHGACGFASPHKYHSKIFDVSIGVCPKRELSRPFVSQKGTFYVIFGSLCPQRELLRVNGPVCVSKAERFF